VSKNDSRPNMLGMMNYRLESFEFYASNSEENANQLPEEDAKVLTEPKKRSSTAYTDDGRMIVDGKVVDEKEAKALWSEVLLRSTAKKVPITSCDEKKTKSGKQSK
ncbi:hypothetical protein PMAYCL1PPCAC_22081, partial [Pristionchus mayeri]